ncbi:MAG: hypothetical protein ACOC2Y_03525 [Spirochaetota bacterium]
MAKRSEPIHIFHLYRKDGTAVLLHPFRETEKLFTLLERSEIRGHYGNEPRVESLTLFRNELYRLVEQEVRAWVADARFIPRFLLSSVIFLVVYLFLSIVVRDPVPLLDEIAISFGVSILAYVLLGRRDMQSEGALKRRIALRTKVDGIVFTESAFVKRIEDELIAREGRSSEQLVEELLRPGSDLVVEGHEREAEQMVAYLEEMFRTTEFRKTEKRLKRMQREGSSGGNDTMRKWLESRKVDVPLLSVYMQLKNTTKTGT